MSGDRAYPFIAKVITAPSEEVGIGSAASRIAEFYSARTKGTESELKWLVDFFGYPGMETFKDTDLIEMIIERELLTGSEELIRCPACGRCFLESSNGKTIRYKEEPFEIGVKKCCDLLSASEVSEIKARAQQDAP